MAGSGFGTAAGVVIGALPLEVDEVALIDVEVLGSEVVLVCGVPIYMPGGLYRRVR